MAQEKDIDSWKIIEVKGINLELPCSIAALECWSTKTALDLKIINLHLSI